MHDLVVLDNATVGVVVNVEADALRVLTNQVCGPPAGAATGTAGPPPPPLPPQGSRGEASWAHRSLPCVWSCAMGFLLCWPRLVLVTAYKRPPAQAERSPACFVKLSNCTPLPCRAGPTSPTSVCAACPTSSAR